MQRKPCGAIHHLSCILDVRYIRTSIITIIILSLYLYFSKAYATVLAFATFFTQQKPNWTARYHTMVLLSALGVYVYRDIWPLATYHSKPADNGEGILLWAKIAILTFTAVSIPLFIPHPYVPVDPQVSSNFHYFPLIVTETNVQEPRARTQSRTDSLLVLCLNVFISRPLDNSCEQGCPFELRTTSSSCRLRPCRVSDQSCLSCLSVFFSSGGVLLIFDLQYIDPFAGAKRRHMFFGLLLFFRMQIFASLNSVEVIGFFI